MIMISLPLMLIMEVLVWRYEAWGSVYSSPCVSDGKVYIGCDGWWYLFAFNASNGNLIWKYQTTDNIISSPRVSAGLVYVGGCNNNLYALNALNGKLIWKYKTGGAVSSSPYISNGVVYVGSEDYYLYAHNASNGNYIWSSKSEDMIMFSSPYVSNGVIYIGSMDYYIYGFNASNGKLAWKYKTGGDVRSSPCVSGGIVYVGSYDTYLYALEAGNTGFEDNRSTKNLPSPSLSVSPNPFRDHLTVSLPAAGGVYSITGTLIKHLPAGRHEIDTSSWKQGAYIVKAGNETKKIIKVE